jgi:5-hydroxyisourate hydrolase
MSPVSAITTHVLDTSIGRPAAGVNVVLERGGKSSEWQVVGHGETDVDGRVRTLMDEQTPLEAGLYRLLFDTRRYFGGRGIRAFYPSVVVMFEVGDEDVRRAPHYHLPLLVSPFGYTTYRGS